MRTRRSESQVPFSAMPLLGFFGSWRQVFLAEGSCSFRAPTTLGLFRFHRLMKKTTTTQTCWAGVKPGPQHPGNYQSGSSNHSVNGFHTLSVCLMILLPNFLKNQESDQTNFFNLQNILPTYPKNANISDNFVQDSGLVTKVQNK